MNQRLNTILQKEVARQSDTIDLIPSENYTSSSVREAVGSIFMHKYSEGYPGARYYEGNENIDELENLCIEMVKKVFKLPSDWGANVQPLSGSNANLAVYNALLNPGDTILSMYLPDGGHLSHGWSYTNSANRTEQEIEELKNESIYKGGQTKISIVSKIYNVVQYKVSKETLLFDYDSIERIALEVKPKLIITGGTAYPRNIDYKRFRQIADKVGAYYMADIAHEAGLIASGVLDSPIGIADVVTFTTHKTLRGPKGAVIVARGDLMPLINKSVMPGLQGGAHNGTIAGITQALFEADSEEFIDYSKKILLNAKILEQELKRYGFNLVSGGTDKHLLLIDLRNKNIGGKYLARALSYAGIVTNMNTIPFEAGSPLNPSGLRIGTPTVTTRGMGESEMRKIAEFINKITNLAIKYANLSFNDFCQEISKDPELLTIAEEVKTLARKYPLKN